MSENRKVFLRGTRKVFLHFCKGSGRYFLQLSSIFARDPGKSAVKKGSRHAQPKGGIWWLTLSNSYCSVCRDTSVPGLSGRQTAQRRFRPGSGSVRGPASGPNQKLSAVRHPAQASGIILSDNSQIAEWPDAENKFSDDLILRDAADRSAS